MFEITSIVRPLSKKKRRLLASALKRSERRLARLPQRLLPGAALIIGILWAGTMIAETGHLYIVTGFWVTLGTVIPLWVYYSQRRKMELAVDRYEEALRRNEAHEIRVQSDAMVALEEEGDEGAAYAFQVDG